MMARVEIQRINGANHVRQSQDKIDIRRYVRSTLSCAETFAALPAGCGSGQDIEVRAANGSTLIAASPPYSKIGRNYALKAYCTDYDINISIARMASSTPASASKGHAVPPRANISDVVDQRTNEAFATDPLTGKPLKWEDLFDGIPFSCSPKAVASNPPEPVAPNKKKVLECFFGIARWSKGLDRNYSPTPSVYCPVPGYQILKPELQFDEYGNQLDLTVYGHPIPRSALTGVPIYDAKEDVYDTTYATIAGELTPSLIIDTYLFNGNIHNTTIIPDGATRFVVPITDTSIIVGDPKQVMEIDLAKVFPTNFKALADDTVLSGRISLMGADGYNPSAVPGEFCLFSIALK